MTQLRSLLLALLLPVTLMPDGMTLCLKRLLGEPVTSSCCAPCCCSKERAKPLPTVATTPGSRCCIAVPETQRSLDPVTRKRADEQIAPPLVLAIVPTFRDFDPFDRSFDPTALSTHDPPSSATVPISLPLRL